MRGDARESGRRYWPNFLRGEPGEIYARLLESDPLRLRERSALRVRERWLLIEPDRAFLRSAARAALCAAQEDAPVELEAWARACVDHALDQILAADRASESAGDPPEDEQRTFPLLTDSLLIAPEQVRATCLAFHALDELTRRAFFELLIEGREVREVLESGPWDADQLHDQVLASLRALGFECAPRTHSLASAPVSPEETT